MVALAVIVIWILELHIYWQRFDDSLEFILIQTKSYIGGKLSTRVLYRTTTIPYH